MTEMTVERKVVFLNDVRLPVSVGVSWIGLQGSAACVKRKFIWWRNSYNESSESLRALCTMLWQHKIDVRIGPPVDFQESIAEKKIRLLRLNNDSLYGIYVREDHYVSFRSNLAKMGISF